MNLLGELATYIGSLNVSIKAISATVEEKTKITNLRLTLEVRSKAEMDNVIKQLRKKTDIIDVFRASGG